ncbi:uncharacterized protein GGS25DRAFT_517973 [Hypoxylon fragiforme]|uniref:uncharacterized protein n=1 Tax=Hypoxylon fragiforme TaxID=63214 RepID=UPI0020C5C56F|nr:uncharacterized protein GGS25DRAFT_517973 [Hypoxylon fragiforme]KAI2612277.1 hypothetical protein GGS25DRAFT_517973 [Hypoxylon fragiforme]
MQPTQSQKQTPNRRRQGGRARTTPQKIYASENDAPQQKSFYDASPSTPTTGGPQSLRSSSTNQKQRTKNNKPRNKNGHKTPGPNIPESLSPSAERKDDNVAIFAGSTFHASPAPSALPIPSFFSKADVDSPSTKAASSPEQGLYSTSNNSSDGSPISPPSIPRAEESPLEFFFRADRAEKEKAQTRRASSDQPNAAILGPYSPPPSHESPKEFSTFPKSNGSLQARRTTSSKTTLSKRLMTLGISADELDGNPGWPVGPAFSTPYNERMRAARSNQSSAQSTPTALRSQDLNSSSHALKRYLFTGQLSPSEDRLQQQTPSKQNSVHNWQQAHPRSPRQENPAHKTPPHRLPRGMFPASILTANAQSGQSSAPPVDGELTSYRSEQLTAMEDGLRRMLKLDSPNHSLPLH